MIRVILFVSHIELSEPCLDIKTVFSGMEISSIKIRRSLDCPIFITGISILVKRYLYIRPLTCLFIINFHWVPYVGWGRISFKHDSISLLHRNSLKIQTLPFYDKMPLKFWGAGSWGIHEAHLGPFGPRWAPCWPHVGPMILAIWGVPANLSPRQMLLKPNKTIMTSSKGNIFRVTGPPWITISVSSGSPQWHRINSEDKHRTLVVSEPRI